VRVLGIESSCDETAAAIVDDGGVVRTDVVASQHEIHGDYGGIVPELAARAHVRNVVPVLQSALAEHGWEGIDAIAVTQGPGLAGALLTGVSVAKALAFARDLPLVGVDHLVAHLFAADLRYPDLTGGSVPERPYVALLVSGGHTALYEVRGPSAITILGQTRDDAAGEAFDKVAKLLGLGYPGGPIIDRLAATGDPAAVELPRPMASKRHLDFSFSGLKTAIARRVEVEGIPTGRALHDLAASFQATVVRILVDKAVHACVSRGVPRLVLGGGVAANRGLRARAVEVASAEGVEVFVPPVRACTDNAAMVAWAGHLKLGEGAPQGLGLATYTKSPDVRRGKFPKRRR
jgi:N6-L-threonylcarbamoyladenine synthase